MSVFSGPEIPNSGMIFQVDAANLRSYPGSGTTWNDVSGYGATCTLYNSMSYTYPYFHNFTGLTGNYIGMNMTAGLASLFSLGTGDFTFSYWVYFNTLSVSFQGLLSIGPSNNNLFRVYTATQLSVIIGGTGYTPTVPTLSINKWTNIAIVRQGGNMTIYVDKVANTPTASVTGSISVSSNDPGYIGNPNFVGQPLEGRMSVFQAYNRALSAAEISTSFDALRDRYNV